MPLRDRRIAEEVAEVLCRCGEMTLLKEEADVVRTAACRAGGKAPGSTPSSLTCIKGAARCFCLSPQPGYANMVKPD
jgi:hypothetical protein